MRIGYGLLGLLVAVAMGVLMAQGDPQAFPTEEAGLQTYRLFPSITRPEQILGMELIIPEQSFAIAVVVEDNQTTWRLREAPFTPVDPQNPQAARDVLGLMEGMQAIHRRDTPLEAFGLLPNPQYVVRFQLDDLRVVTLYIGHQTPSGDAYYVSSGEESVIVDLVSTMWIDNFVAFMLTLEPGAAQLNPIPTPRFD